MHIHAFQKVRGHCGSQQFPQVTLFPLQLQAIGDVLRPAAATSPEMRASSLASLDVFVHSFGSVDRDDIDDEL